MVTTGYHFRDETLYAAVLYKQAGESGWVG
jgi:hypothetical protein